MSLHCLKPTILSTLLNPLLAYRFNSPSLKKALGILLDKPGKPFFNLPSSLSHLPLPTLFKILERVAASCLSP